MPFPCVAGVGVKKGRGASVAHATEAPRHPAALLVGLEPIVEPRQMLEEERAPLAVAFSPHDDQRRTNRNRYISRRATPLRLGI